jgi:hypothetical protein
MSIEALILFPSYIDRKKDESTPILIDNRDRVTYYGLVGVVGVAGLVSPETQ